MDDEGSVDLRPTARWRPRLGFSERCRNTSYFPNGAQRATPMRLFVETAIEVAVRTVNASNHQVDRSAPLSPRRWFSGEFGRESEGRALSSQYSRS